MTYRILKIHGCSGAGKTTIARQLMEASETVSIVEKHNGKHEAYMCQFPAIPTPIIILGSYKNNCGGMDTVSSAREAIKLVKFYHDVGHVIHEGLLQSTYYGAMGVDSKQYGDAYIYGFLDTPLETCLRRVIARREANNTKNKFNPQLTADKFHTIAALKEKLPRLGHKVVTIHHDVMMVPQVLTILGELQ